MKRICTTTTFMVSILAITSIVGNATNAFAQAEIVPEDEITGAGDADISGWNPSLAVNGTLNLVENSNVVGQVEGLSMLFGLGLAGGADYVDGPSVWRNELTIAESFAKTPVVDRFIKTNDQVAVASTYNYFLTKTMGGFARGRVNTSLFTARAITADNTDYIITESGEGAATRNVTSKQLKVSSAFKPFTLAESIGGFAEPINKKNFSLRVRAGLGGRHTLASGVLVQNDDDTTPQIEMQELANVHQAGVEVFAGIAGKAKEDRISYTIGASLLLPLINNDSFGRSATDLTRLGIEASATISVFDWMGIVYKGSVIVDPQLFPADKELTQFQNSLLLTFQYTLIDRKKGLVELKKEAALDQAKQDKEAAEKKAMEAEEHAKELERQLEEAKQREVNQVGPTDPAVTPNPATLPNPPTTDTPPSTP